VININNKLLIRLFNFILFPVIVFSFLYMWLLQRWGGMPMIVFVLCCPIILIVNLPRKGLGPGDKQAHLDTWLLKDIGRNQQGQEGGDSSESEGD